MIIISLKLKSAIIFFSNIKLDEKEKLPLPIDFFLLKKLLSFPQYNNSHWNKLIAIFCSSIKFDSLFLYSSPSSSISFEDNLLIGIFKVETLLMLF